MKYKQKANISLIVTTYNRVDALELVLLSIINQKILPKEVIIADDGSDKNTSELIKKYQKIFPVNLIHSWIEDKGFRVAKSRNVAISKATSDYIVIIDGDIVLHKNFIKTYSKNLKQGEFIVGSRVLLNKNFTQKIIEQKTISISPFSRGIHKNRLNCLYIPFLHKIIKGKTKCLKGVKSCNMGFWRDDIFRVNGFDERYEGWGREDSDLVARFFNLNLKRKNFKWASICYHLSHGYENRENLDKNSALLEEVKKSKIIKAKIGLDKYSF